MVFCTICFKRHKEGYFRKLFLQGEIILCFIDKFLFELYFSIKLSGSIEILLRLKFSLWKYDRN